MAISEHNDMRICAVCRVVVVLDNGQWVHPEQFRLKFSDSVCDNPQAGRTAKSHETRFGRGRSSTRDRYSMHGAIPELAQPAGVPITIGVDGSYKLVTTGVVRKPMSWAFVTTSGVYGLGTATIPGNIVGGDRALQGELRAIWWALHRAGADHPVDLITDSMDAIELLRDWRSGLYRMPRGYTLERASGRQATLLQLAQLVHQRGDEVTVTWVRSHTGHPLNEGADALARMARAWATGRLTRDTVAADARRTVLAALSRHAACL